MLAQIKALYPTATTARLTLYAPHLFAAMHEFEITNTKRIAAFLANLAVESGELRYMTEIASGEAYEGHKGLGNTQRGDGIRYKGRSPIQLTGRANYREYGKLLGLPLEAQPELAALPQHGFRIAGAYWKKKGLNKLADQNNFREIVRRINGGYTHYERRLSYYNKALGIFNVLDAIPKIVEATGDAAKKVITTADENKDVIITGAVSIGLAFLFLMVIKR